MLLDVQRLIFDRFKLNVSVTTVKRARKRLGWVKSGVKYCQLVKEKNRIERLAFATKCQTNNDMFDNVIFTDELSIWLEQHAKLCFRRSHEAPKLKPKVKHPLKVHIWAGISKRGTTDMAIFTGNMCKEFYVDVILAKYLKPFIEEVFPSRDYRFVQDNDPKHKSKFVDK